MMGTYVPEGISELYIRDQKSNPVDMRTWLSKQLHACRSISLVLVAVGDSGHNFECEIVVQVLGCWLRQRAWNDTNFKMCIHGWDEAGTLQLERENAGKDLPVMIVSEPSAPAPMDRWSARLSDEEDRLLLATQGFVSTVAPRSGE